MFTVDSKIQEVNAKAKEFGIKFVGVKKAVLVAQVNEAIQAQQVEEPVQTEVTKVSKHFRHANCQELVTLLTQVDIETAVTTRGTVNVKEVALITDKEKELIKTFIETGYNIQGTGKVLGFSHTNVWQRLYGNNKPVKTNKGILGKLREYVAEQQSEAV